MTTRSLAAAALATALAVCPAPAAAQIVVSANDADAVLVDGVNVVPASKAVDTVTVFDASVLPPRVIGEVQAPSSVIGPTGNVAISPDGAIAVVSSSTRRDPADPTKTVADDTVSVIGLTGTPAVLSTVHAGTGASGVAFSPDGRLVLVANRGAGTVSVFTVTGRTLSPAATVNLGAPQSGPSQVVFTPDGRRALVTRNNDSLVSILAINGVSVTYTKQDTAAGLKPYGVDITPDGRLAVVANIGTGATGGVDTLSVIDLTLDPVRTVAQVAVGPTPEALAISPDGRFVAITVMNGSNAVPSSSTYNAFGLLRVFSLSGSTMAPVADARIGQWCQGVTWTSDSRVVMAQCMTQREIQLFRFDGKNLSPAGSLPVNGAPAGIGAKNR